MSHVSKTHTSPFDAICHIEMGQETWSARELQSPLGYAQWRQFEDAIDRAKIACQNSGHEVDQHFAGVRKTSPMPNGGAKEIQDYRLSRYACYLTAMNGDPRKPEISAAQTYFAVKTHEAETARGWVQYTTPLQGDDFLSGVRDLLHVPTLKELQVVERYIHAAKALYPQKGGVAQIEVTKQLPAPKDKNTVEYVQAHILKHLNNHGPLTFNTLYHSYMKNRDEMTVRKALDLLVEQGIVQKETTSHAVKFFVVAAYSQEA
jgi:hypothetical protein